MEWKVIIVNAETVCDRSRRSEVSRGLRWRLGGEVLDQKKGEALSFGYAQVVIDPYTKLDKAMVTEAVPRRADNIEESVFDVQLW